MALTRESYIGGESWQAHTRPIMPVAKVYSIRNSSTSLILLNNKMSRKYSHLRGQTEMEADTSGDRILAPNPERHFQVSTPVNKEIHSNCMDSQSPRFTPSPTGLEWYNSLQRPASTFSNGSLVNPRHHYSCRVPSYPEVERTNSSPKRSTKWGPPRSLHNRMTLEDSDLSWGQKNYLWSIARVYSSANLKRQKQQQYFNLLQSEMRKGDHKNHEYYRYASYLYSPRKTQCGVDERIDRPKSVPPAQICYSSSNSSKCSDETSRTPRSTSMAPASNARPGRSSARVIARSSMGSRQSSSSRSSSSISIDRTVYTSREGTSRPKSRIGPTKDRTAAIQVNYSRKIEEEPKEKMDENSKYVKAVTDSQGTNQKSDKSTNGDSTNKVEAIVQQSPEFDEVSKDSKQTHKQTESKSSNNDTLSGSHGKDPPQSGSHGDPEPNDVATNPVLSENSSHLSVNSDKNVKTNSDIQVLVDDPLPPKDVDQIEY